MKAGLVVNIEQVGLLRAARGESDPDPVHFALQAELAGATGIRAHLRLDRKYLNEQDVDLLYRLLRSRFFLQISPHGDPVHWVNALRPDNLLLAAERREGRGGEVGLDAVLLQNEIAGLVRNIDNRQTSVFLHLEPMLDQIKAAAKLGVDGIVLNIRDLPGTADLKHFAYNKLKDAVRLAGKYGLEVHVSGGITERHLPLLAGLQEIHAVHVGHSLVSRALLTGVREAVQHFNNGLSST